MKVDGRRAVEVWHQPWDGHAVVKQVDRIRKKARQAGRWPRDVRDRFVFHPEASVCVLQFKSKRITLFVGKIDHHILGLQKFIQRRDTAFLAEARLLEPAERRHRA